MPYGPRAASNTACRFAEVFKPGVPLPPWEFFDHPLHKRPRFFYSKSCVKIGYEKLFLRPVTVDSEEYFLL
jgi:hypothetical protein